MPTSEPSEVRDALSMPGILIVQTTRGNFMSPQIEWDGTKCEYTFHVPAQTWVNTWMLVHPDGAILYEGTAFEQYNKEGKFTVCINADLESEIVPDVRQKGDLG